MIVISDTSSVSNLIQIGIVDILEKIYKKIIITPGVYAEISRLTVQKKIIDQADWIEIIEPKDKGFVKELMLDLDLGESESIALAKELNADYLIIDEFLGRQKAEKFDIKITGLLGILILAKKSKIIKKVKPYIDELVLNGFRLNKTLIEKVLRGVGEL